MERTVTGFGLPEPLLPSGFAYPATYRHAVKVGLVDIEPWYLLSGEDLLRRQTRVAEMTGRTGLVPFAATTTGDEVACLVHPSLEVVIVDDTEPLLPGEQLRRLPDVDAWFREALDDFIDFAREP